MAYMSMPSSSRVEHLAQVTSGISLLMIQKLILIIILIILHLKLYISELLLKSIVRLTDQCLNQGILNEGEGSENLTSLY